MIFQRSADVPQFSRYQDYRLYLRFDFQYCCAYCLTHERYFLDGEAGEIDHHRPLHPPKALGKDFSHLVNAYSNLYWSCPRCNLYKGNLWPTDEEYERGERFLDPCLEDHDTHWETHTDGTLTAKTATGSDTIQVLRRDRPWMNRRRAALSEDRQKLARLQQELEHAELAPEHRQMMLEYLSDLSARIPPPFSRGSQTPAKTKAAPATKRGDSAPCPP